ncbi:MAG: Flp pilus assembly complex ATPase component TadA [Proteobacteria bacterium]|nr:Flp pilus assembly complex ATPase component TadA [Pseudomonadota bacterium]
MFQVTVSNSRGKVQSINCNAPICAIGKSVENLVVLQGWDVARTHAVLVVQDDGVHVRDEGSRAGTTVNAHRISRSYGPLQPDDVVGIGSYRIQAVLQKEVAGVAASATPAPALPASGPSLARAPAPEPAAAAGHHFDQGEYAVLRIIHDRIISRMDFRRLDVTRLSEVELRAKTRELIDEIINEDPGLIGAYDRNQLARNALNEAIGLGPLEVLLADESISEVMVNGFDQVFIERAGRLEPAPVVFSSDKAVLSAIERIVTPLGRRIDEGSPMVDARLRDGSRVNAVIPPLALKGPSITIRKFAKRKLVAKDLVDFGSASVDMMNFLRLCVEQRRNVVISGGTGSGKTTLLNILSNFIPDRERVITVEDAAELRLGMNNLVSLESRPANIEGKGAVTIRDLVRNCLRMRPDRIVVGECRGGEALDMLQAMNTGHDGSLTTVHANAPRDTLARLEVMVLMAGMDLPVLAIRQQVSSAINIIVQQNRMSDGSRKITHITEVCGMENGVIQLQDIFQFRQHGFDSERRVIGEYAATGRVPEFYEELGARGIEIDRTLFFAKSGGRHA